MNTFWRSLAQTLAKNPISTFAVLCVAATAAFLGYMTLRMAGVLESPQWCGRAIQAERISAENFKGLEGCIDLLKIQLTSMSTGFHISVSAFAFSLIVLVVIVVAGARANAKLGADGMEFNVSKHGDPAVAAADHVVAGAVEAAAEVKTDTVPPSPVPAPPPPGPGWPQ